ncbi:MAG: hypothetical protein GY757_06935, partial [bacterium]|nr:hypothetical protein [bacterium]
VDTNSDGDALKKILCEKSISTDYLIHPDNFRTPKKSRILSGGDNTKKQQVLRIDTLNNTDIEPGAYTDIENTLLELLKETDYLIVSDYLFESVTPDVFSRIREQHPGKFMIIDSRQNLLEFNNATIATPNEPEVKRIFHHNNFYNEKDFYVAGNELLERLNVRGIILKRGHEGMIVFEKEKEPFKIEIYGSPDIVDVTGAGDTVISVFTLALSAGANLVSASQLANIAAGIVVMKEGAYPIGFDELENELKQIS